MASVPACGTRRRTTFRSYSIPARNMNRIRATGAEGADDRPGLGRGKEERQVVPEQGRPEHHSGQDLADHPGLPDPGHQGAQDAGQGHDQQDVQTGRRR